MQSKKPPPSREAAIDTHSLQLLAAETAVEAVHASAGIDQLLLARVERMALGADFHVDLGLGGAGLDDVAARAGDGAVNVLGMDTLFHSFHLISGSDVQGPYSMYAPITTFNFSYPVERPWERLPYYYSTTQKKCKRKNASRADPGGISSAGMI